MRGFRLGFWTAGAACVALAGCGGGAGEGPTPPEVFGTWGRDCNSPAITIMADSVMLPGGAVYPVTDASLDGGVLTLSYDAGTLITDVYQFDGVTLDLTESLTPDGDVAATWDVSPMQRCDAGAD